MTSAVLPPIPREAHARMVARLEAALAALRKHAIFTSCRLEERGEIVPFTRCIVCKQDWHPTAREAHGAGCPLGKDS